MRLYHLVDRSAYDERAVPYVHPSLDGEGFIHCSTAAQLDTTMARHFPPDADLLVLEIDPDRLTSEVRWERGAVGEDFPHVYGPIDAEAVVGIRPARRG